MPSSFDYIIVGAGTAGCLLANRLSADSRNSVLLLEAGGKDDYFWIHVPVGYLYCIDNPRTDWRHRTEPEPGLNGRQLMYPRGKVLGGCSSINGMIYMRGQQQDYDDWAARGCTGWDWASVLPYFIKSENHHLGAQALHGAGGELRVERQRLSWPILDAFREAAAQAGIPSVDDFNTGDNFGCGYFEVNQKRGVRWNASKAFLRSVMHRPNLTVVTHANVTRLDIDAQHVCQGVHVEINGQPQSFQATREVILSAGAIGSPALLERSGIGDAQHLQHAGLNCQVHLPGVGENLQDHLQLRLAFRITGAATLNVQANSVWGKLSMGLRYLWDQSGPLSMSPSQLGCFARTPSSPGRANVQYHVQPLSLDRFGEPLHAFAAFTASVCDLQPTSRGSVHITKPASGPGPGQGPQGGIRIAPNYLSTERDRQIACEAITLTRHIVAQAALRPHAPQEFMPGPHLRNEAELIQAAAQIGTTIFHPVGTCKMGPATDPMAVVAPDLKVHGVQRLRIVDASVMPTITSGNTNAPTTMIAEKAADLILAQASQQRRI